MTTRLPGPSLLLLLAAARAVTSVRRQRSGGVAGSSQLPRRWLPCCVPPAHCTRCDLKALRPRGSAQGAQAALVRALVVTAGAAMIANIVNKKWSLNQYPQSTA